MTIDEIVFKIDNGETITQEEKRTVIEHFGRRCAGPLTLDAETQKRLLDALGDEELPLDDAHDLKEIHNLSVPEPKDDSREELEAFVRGVARARLGCGENLNPLILALPTDGKDHTITCPRCGTVASIRTMKANVQ